MSQVEWAQVKDVFYTALNRPVAERSDFLDSACGRNGALRSEVEVLLDSYESGFLENPLLGADSAKNPSNQPLFEQGKKFSHYEILRLLGRGGMGEVYLANDLALDRLMAIKVIHNDSGFGDQAAGRLVREAKAAAKLDHPNICSVYEVGETDGQPFIAMQYVEGEMLDSLIERGSITFEDAVSFTRQIGAALAKAHSWGIVHRDIKPSNIIIDSRNHLKVLDFGLAKETSLNSADPDASANGLIAGTVTYMSPEHTRGQEINGQTDIWSLGVVLYQMLTGSLPFRGETKADLISAILNNEPEPVSNLSEDVPPSINYILNRALQKDKDFRYATIEEFDADLAELVETGTVSNSSGIVSAKSFVNVASASPTVSHQRGWFFGYALSALLLLVLAGGSFGVWQYRSANAAALPFSAATVGGLQTSTLYDLKRPVGGVILHLSYSPDGTRIAFTLGDKKEHVVYVQSLAGGDPVPVTDAGAVNFSPVWSPDGQRLAYFSVSSGKMSIRSVPYSGGESTQLLDLERSSGADELRKWSRDGKRIFLTSGGVPSTIDLETAIISPIDLSGMEGKIGRDFAVSPDESRMLAISTVDGKEQLWVKSLDNNNARRLFDTFLHSGGPDWFSDNHRFAFSSDETGKYQIYVSNVDGAQPQQITSGNSDSTAPKVSFGGNRIIYLSAMNEANLFSTDIESKKETVVTSKTNMQVLPAFSPDGRRIAYGTISDPMKLSSGILKIDSFDRNENSPALQVGPSGCYFKWLPNGEEIAFVRRTGTNSNIWKVGVNGQKETQITTGGIVLPFLTIAPVDLHAFPFTLSADGLRAAFVSQQSGRDNIWAVATDGADEKMLTDLRGDATKLVSPLWSPDGDRVAFIEAMGAGSAVGSEENRVSIFNKGSVTIRAEFKSLATLLCWSETGDGVYVAVAGDRHYDVYFVGAIGRNTSIRKITLPNARQYGIRISPDQKWVVYTERLNSVDNLYLAPMDGGQTKRITMNIDATLFYSGVTWSPDSKTLIYSKQTGGLQISLISNTQQGDEIVNGRK